MSPRWVDLLTPTGIIALWGAILGTITLVWNICRDVLDRPKLKVMTYVMEVGARGMGVVAVVLTYSIVNEGRRQITVTNVGGKVKHHPTNATYFAILYEREFGTLPQTLAHSQTCSVSCRDLSVLNDNLEECFAVDSTGRRWKATEESMKGLRASSEWNKHGPKRA
jgi:hypothetical protein